jgi:hypothetical protein
MSSGVDLNQLRDAVVKARQEGGKALPNFKVSTEGNIVSNPDAQNSSGQPLTEIPAETFALTLADRMTYTQVMPRAAELMSVDGFLGIYYTVISEFGDRFEFFLYQQAGYYHVKVIYPEIERRWRSAHTGHLYNDGNICFGNSYESGMPTMRGAFSKSVLWAQGMSVALRTNEFPF